MHLTRPVAIFFDLDQTLVYSTGFEEADAATCAAVAARRPELDASTLLEANAKVWENNTEAHLHDWETGRLSGRRLSLLSWQQTLSACGLVDDDLAEFAASMSTRLIDDTYRLYPDAREFVDAVAQLDLKTALVTNGAADSQRAKIAAVGLGDWFDVLAVSGDNGILKPAPDAFLAPMAALGVSGKSVWHIGDNTVTDVAGANAAGLTSIWINREGATAGRDDPAPDLEVVQLTALIARLDPP